jgi:hypothetical protein
MCIICVDLAKGALTGKDARRHLGEMRVTLGDHAREVQAKIEEYDATPPPAPATTKP